MARYSRERSKIGTLRPGGLRFGALEGEPSASRDLVESADFMRSRPAGNPHGANGGAAQQEIRGSFLSCLPRS
jgi:hypothetical protein